MWLCLCSSGYRNNGKNCSSWILPYSQKLLTILPLLPMHITSLAPKCSSRSFLSLLFSKDGRCFTNSLHAPPAILKNADHWITACWLRRNAPITPPSPLVWAHAKPPRRKTLKLSDDESENKTKTAMNKGARHKTLDSLNPSLLSVPCQHKWHLAPFFFSGTERARSDNTRALTTRRALKVSNFRDD